MLTELEHIELAKEIAANRGNPEWAKANVARLRAAVDSIRTRRQEWREAAKPAKGAKASGAKATVQQITFEDLGFGAPSA